jgi:uncharacterized protein (DUF2237 family)
MNLQESIKKILREEVSEDKNLYGEKLKACSTKPMTGFYRDGYCRTGDNDTGSHTVCARVTEEFLEFTKSMGNNLDMLEPGDKWCLCAKRWEEANKEGVEPEMIKSSTNIKTLDIIDSVEQELDEYARTLKNARRQGVGLRFPKSAVRANPQRFRKYTRDNIKESVNKSEDKKLKLVKEMIYSLFDEVEFMNESSNRSEKDTKKLFKIVRMIMEDLILPEYDHLICSYEITLNEVFNIPEVTVLFIGGHGTKLWPITQGIRQMYLDVLEDISKEIANYTGVVIGVRGEQTPKCGDKENIYLRESENKSEDKKLKLVKLLEKDGLYNFIEMTGLDFNQVRSLLKQIDNPKEILKQYIREFVLEKGGVSGENYGSLFGLKIRLSNTKLINDIMVQDSDQIAFEIWEFYEDNYGQRITKDQYLTTINSLTNEELLSIISWMMETIKNGDWY